MRKLADAGFSINLDDKLLKVYCKENGKIIFEGTYEKPNWIVKFEIKRDFNDKGILKEQCENYSCKARIVKDHELPDQSQTMSFEADQLSVSEGERAQFFARIGGRKF